MQQGRRRSGRTGPEREDGRKEKATERKKNPNRGICQSFVSTDESKEREREKDGEEEDRRGQVKVLLR